jgi:nitrite reductase/ring-hydroxylating ferredoxin subunit
VNEPGYAVIANDGDLWDGDMECYDLDGAEILLARIDGTYHAYDGSCPHQGTSLADGRLEDGLLTCSAHEWEFDLRTGLGVNPATACLRRYAVRVAEGKILVSRTAKPAARTT